MLIRYAFLLFGLTYVSVNTAMAAVKDWPQEAQAYLQNIPGQKLTLEMIVGQAVNQADVFQAHKSEAIRAEAVELQTLAAEDVTLTTSYNYYDSHADPVNPNFKLFVQMVGKPAPEPTLFSLQAQV